MYLFIIPPTSPGPPATSAAAGRRYLPHGRGPSVGHHAGAHSGAAQLLRPAPPVPRQVLRAAQRDCGQGALAMLPLCLPGADSTTLSSPLVEEQGARSEWWITQSASTSRGTLDYYHSSRATSSGSNVCQWVLSKRVTSKRISYSAIR